MIFLYNASKNKDERLYLLINRMPQIHTVSNLLIFGHLRAQDRIERLACSWFSLLFVENLKFNENRLVVWRVDAVNVVIHLLVMEEVNISFV